MTPRKLAGAGTRRIDLGLAAALLLVAAAGTIAYGATHRLGDAATQVNRAHEVLSYTERALSGLVDAETSELGYVITGDTAYLAPWRAAARRIHGELRALHELSAGDPLLEARLSALNALAARRLRLVEQTIDARRNGSVDSAAALAASGQAKQVMDAARSLVGAIHRTERQRLDAATARAADVGRFARVSVAAGLLMAFLLVLGGMLAVRRELRERRRAEAALRENQARLQQFMDTLPIGTFIADAAGRATFANTTALAMLGQDSLTRQDAYEALPLWRIGGERPVPREENPLTLALRGLAAGADTFELRSGRRPLPVEIFATPVFDSAGRVAYAIATISDVTERKRHQAALRAAKEAAEHASQAKSDFLARMSHELRTPLNAIIGFGNILVKKSGMQGRERTYAERILENGKQLLVLINDILDLARIEAGRLSVERQPVALGTLVDEVLRQWEASEGEGGAVRLEAALPPELEPVETDPLRLRQVLVNLVGNAMKFTGAGSVRVTVETVAGTRRPNAIRVSDTGIGIAPERMAAVFEAFEQAENSTSRRFGGTGLGLAISRALCQALGYRLTAKSEPGVGSEFTIELEPSAVPEPGVRAAGDVRRLALVVDDEPAGRARLVARIEALGCRAVAAASSEHARHLARALHPGVIVLRADADGAPAFLAALREEDGLGAVALVAVAQESLGATERARLREAGALVVEGGGALERGLAGVLAGESTSHAELRP